MNQLPASLEASNLLFFRFVALAVMAVETLSFGAATTCQAFVVNSGSAVISFDTTTPNPTSTNNGTSDYGGYVTGLDGTTPQITVGGSPLTLNEDSSAWDGAIQGLTPVGAYTFRDNQGSNQRPAAFLLDGVLDTTGLVLNPTGINEFTQFSITGLTWALREGNYEDNDEITLNIVDLDNGNAVVATGNLEAQGGGLNSQSFDVGNLGGLFSETIFFTPIPGFVTSANYRLEVDFSGANWGGGAEGFWLSLDPDAELVANYHIPEPSTGLLLALTAAATLLAQRRRRK